MLLDLHSIRLGLSLYLAPINTLFYFVQYYEMRLTTNAELACSWPRIRTKSTGPFVHIFQVVQANDARLERHAGEC